MELFKNFSLGGLFQAGRKMAPPWGSFRRFTNTYKDQSGTLKPYGKGIEEPNDPVLPSGSGMSGFFYNIGVLSSQVFRKGILQLHAVQTGAGKGGVFSYLGPYLVPEPIMQPFRLQGGENFVEVDKHLTYRPSGNLSTCTVARKAYMASMVDTSDFTSNTPYQGFSPEESYLMAFDGLRLRGAGLPLPWTFASNPGVGDHYARAVYMTIGMDGEAIFSPYLQVRLGGTTQDVYLSGYEEYPHGPRVDVVGATTFPTYRRSEDHLFERKILSGGLGSEPNLRYFDKRFAASTAATILNDKYLQITSAKRSDALDIGDWIMLNVGDPIGDIPASLYMFQISAIDSSYIVFSDKFKYLDRNSVSWIDTDLGAVLVRWAGFPDIVAQFMGIAASAIFSNLYMIVNYSTTASEGYRVCGIFPVAWDSDLKSLSANFAYQMPFEVPWAGVVSSLMEDWYEATIVKTTFPPVKGITSYKDLLVGFDSNAIYFSDISFGGSTEMVSGISNLAPEGSEFGDLTAICGSEEFFFFSRERKNYIIVGDLAGSTISVTECDSAVPGAYNARCVTNAWGNQVIFMNSTGIFSVNSSGVIKDISEEIKGLFIHSNRDHNLFDKGVFKSLKDTRIFGTDGSIFKFTLEENRGFVVLTTAQADGFYNITKSNMLVYNTRDGKWYEFEGGTSSSVEAMEGKLIPLGKSKSEEDGVMRGADKQLLVTQRMTVDVPSLEKQICQLKFFGEITPTAGGVREVVVGQLNDWEDFDGGDRSNWNTNTSYSPESHEIYAHKKRMNSSKPVATSIILESLATGSFEVEGMEIEGVVTQQGMKK